MQSRPETVLATLPGSSDRERLVVVLAHSASGSTQVELRQQSWGEGLGWYTQSSVQLEPSQVAGLRQSLGLGGSFAQVRTAAFPASGPKKLNGFTPRVVHGDVG
ncbi:MAG TPA: hypothetical protein VL096_20830 [Pirellulaceae bacterium]|nr:hypothetical protein [Pirellulaceae bacterium]